MPRCCTPDERGRCWVTVDLVARPDAPRGRGRGTVRPIADTGCPAELVLSERSLRQFVWNAAAGIPTNFGWVPGHVVRVVLPALGFDRRLLAYASDSAAKIARADGFAGIAGKAFLDSFHWSNGKGGELCLQTWETYRPRRLGAPED